MSNEISNNQIPQHLTKSNTSTNTHKVSTSYQQDTNASLHCSVSEIY